MPASRPKSNALSCSVRTDAARRPFMVATSSITMSLPSVQMAWRIAGIKVSGFACCVRARIVRRPNVYMPPMVWASGT
jgi:hypothetical protein